MQTVTVDPLVGRLLEGRYRIVSRIARGGMSTVYAAVDERLDRRVAVKVMSSALSADEKFGDRFAREARAAARLSHVNAVAVYDQGIDDTGGSHHVFLVMELVQGRTLRDLIRERRGRFTAAEAVSIMEPVLSALSAAHRAGLVHRDVKPENILLSDDGLVKVADFGLARAVDADAASTRTGLMMGTVAYCAPEQIVRGTSDQRSDVYSAGIVLFELLTGRTPYQGDSAMNVAYQHVHSRVPAPSSRVRSVPNELDEIVVAATDSDPLGRPEDASSLLAELADTRSALALPVVAIPPRERVSAPRERPAEPRGTGGRGRGSGLIPRLATGPLPTAGTAPVRGADDHATGLLPGASGTNDTTVVGRREGTPPPPVVTPPRRTLSPRARRRRRRLIALFAVLVLGALSATGGVVGVRVYKEWNTKIPDVGGHSVAAATAALRSTGYAVDAAVTSKYSEDVPAGQVIGTAPAVGDRLAQGRSVHLVVSLGKDRVPVPDVSTQSLSAAETTLQRRGLQFDPTPLTQHSVGVPQGYVIRTSPRAGAPVRRTDRITFVISSGPPSVDVPRIAPGTAYDVAVRRLRQAHLESTKVTDYSDTVAVGSVIRLESSGTAAYGSTVTVVVSQGPEFVTIPDFGTLPKVDDVVAQLQQLGLRVDVQASAFGGKTGRVISIDPGSGSQARPGDTITVTVV